MSGFRFSLRQLLVGVALVALVLLVVRYAMRSQALAAGALAFGGAALLFLLANVLIYGVLRGIGRLYGFESLPPVPPPDQPAGTTEEPKTE